MTSKINNSTIKDDFLFQNEEEEENYKTYNLFREVFFLGALFSGTFFLICNSSNANLNAQTHRKNLFMKDLISIKDCRISEPLVFTENKNYFNTKKNISLNYKKINKKDFFEAEDGRDLDKEQFCFVVGLFFGTMVGYTLMDHWLFKCEERAEIRAIQARENAIHSERSKAYNALLLLSKLNYSENQASWLKWQDSKSHLDLTVRQTSWTEFHLWLKTTTENPNYK